MKRSLKLIVVSGTKNLGIYILLLLLGSLNIIVTMGICILTIINSLIYLANKSKIRSLYSYIFYTSLGNFLTYHMLVESYAETLPWETGVHVAFYFTSYFYYFCFNKQKSENLKNFQHQGNINLEKQL